MPRQQISLKQLSIDKDNSAIVIAVGLAAFVIVFSLVASQALLQQSRYQAKVIGKKKSALKQLRINAEEVEKLKSAYFVFAEKDQNILGGNAAGSGERDGENPRIILDALPSKYDFPALTTSLEKVFKPYGLQGITGTDDEINQTGAEATPTPQPVEIPFTVAVKSNAQSTKEILQLLEKSIRPIQVQRLSLIGSSDQLEVNIEAKTYFQPQKKFDVRTEIVK